MGSLIWMLVGAVPALALCEIVIAPILDNFLIERDKIKRRRLLKPNVEITGRGGENED